MSGRPSTAALQGTTTVVALAGLVAGGLAWSARSGVPHAAAPGATPVATVAATHPSTAAASPTVTSRPAATCATVAHHFDPTSISVPGVTAAAAVVTPPRTSQGIPGAPPLTSRGKTEFAWDRQQGIRPGDPAGNVLLNAHTWPDGSAIGNRLLAGLQRGDPIVVAGAGERLCYRVTQRVEVLASRGLARYYDRTGPAQIAIVVCSGRRLGPGVWTKRTIWFGRPSV